MNIKLLSPLAKIPERADSGASGYDLSSIENYTILPGERKLIKTGISLAIPPGWYGHISDRSGMAYKKGGHTMGKIIDENFRKEVCVIILNTDKKDPIHILAGERVAQIIFKEYGVFDFNVVDDLDETDRGGGFGSSGECEFIRAN